MTAPTRTEQQAAAEQSLTELGLAAPPGWTGEPRTHPLMNVAHGATDSGLLSSEEVAEDIVKSVRTVETQQKRKAALKLAGESDAVAEVLAQADKLPGELVNRMHDAIRPLRAQVERELATAMAFAKDLDGEPDVLSGPAERNVERLEDTLRTLNQLSDLSILTPSTLDARLRAVEELRARVAAGAGE